MAAAAAGCGGFNLRATQWRGYSPRRRDVPLWRADGPAAIMRIGAGFSEGVWTAIYLLWQASMPQAA